MDPDAHHGECGQKSITGRSGSCPRGVDPSLLLGIGKVFFDQERITDALKYFEKIVKEYPKSDSTLRPCTSRGSVSTKALTTQSP